MKTAFKEWAVVCRALAAGRTSLILRRGGIAEVGGRFRVEAPEFLLFPTSFHQDPGSVIHDARVPDEEFDAMRPAEGTLALTHAARVAHSFAVDTPRKLAALRPFHVWSDDVALERFEREGKHDLAALVVRVSALPRRIVLPMRDSYGGCRSWVELEEEVSVEGAVPVMSDAAFTDVQRAIGDAMK